MFNYEDFNGLLDNVDAAKHVAERANDLIDQNGTIIYGEALQDKDGNLMLLDFSTEKKESSTHVAIVLKVAQMREFKPLSGEFTVMRDRTTQVQFDKAKKEEIDKLKRENKALRSNDSK